MDGHSHKSEILAADAMLNLQHVLLGNWYLSVLLSSVDAMQRSKSIVFYVCAVGRQDKLSNNIPYNFMIRELVLF